MNGSASHTIFLKISPPTAEIQIKRPDGINILDRPLMAALRDAVMRVGDQGSIKTAIIFSGNREGFAAGADMQELRKLDGSSGAEYSSTGQTIFSMMASSPVIFIAAVAGYCIGGGFDLALACDIILASRKSYFQHPGTSRGFITGWGGNFRLPRTARGKGIVPLLMEGAKIDAARAAALGLVMKSGSPLPSSREDPPIPEEGETVLRAARKMAERLTSLEAGQIELIKKIINLSGRSSLASKLSLESHLSLLCSLSFQEEGTPRKS